MKKYHTLQNLILPNLSFGAPEEMYARCCNHEVHPHLSDQKLIFLPKGVASFDTFYNSITIQAWKKNTSIHSLALRLSGSGTFFLRFGLHRIGQSHRFLSEQKITLDQHAPCIVPVTAWPDITSGMLYYSLEAITEGFVDGGAFITEDTPAQEVKLGIVITHFNRKKYVLPAIQRIREQLLNDPEHQHRIELIVVDNSRNLTQEETQGSGITLIPNQNLGGSGGFMRGLLHLEDQGSFTHCLFMDDDASCEIESIKRTYQLLSYSHTERFAISGSLLRDVEPYRLHEKGAYFDKGWHARKSGFDMRHIHDLLFAELNDQPINYGAWWFFAFKLSDVNFYSFPFFVRGDDAFFGVSNSFNILTGNGIGCWGEDFWYKEMPIHRYFSMRSNAILPLLLNKKQKLIPFIKSYISWYASAIFSMNYASAKAIILALQHVNIGPKFWQDHINTESIRHQIASFNEEEKFRSMDRSSVSDDDLLVYGHPHESKLRKWIRVLSMNGFLLPSFMLKKKIMFQHKHFRANFREIFRHQKVWYEYEPLNQGYIATHNKKKFFSYSLEAAWVLIKFVFKFRTLRKQYLAALPEMTSRKFWERVYCMDEVKQLEESIRESSALHPMDMAQDLKSERVLAQTSSPTEEHSNKSYS